MRFDIESMLARAAECENQSMYIECALTGVMVDYYFDEFLKAASTSSAACGDSKDNRTGKRSAIDGDGARDKSGTHEPAARTSPISYQQPSPNGSARHTVKVNKKHRAVEIDGCRIFFIRFDDVITKRMFDDGGVIWDYIVEEDE